MKTCTKCGLTLPATRDFFYYKQGKILKRLAAECIACSHIRVQGYKRKKKGGYSNLDPDVMKVREKCVAEARAKYKAWEERIGVTSREIWKVSCAEADSVF